MIGIGRADQGEIVLVGNREDDPRIGLLEQIGIGVVEQFRHHDMRSAHPAQAMGGGDPGEPVDIVGGRPARIDDRARGEALAFRLDPPHPVLAPGGGDGRVQPDIRPAFARIDGVERHQPRIVDPQVRIFERMGQPVFERGARFVLAQAHAGGAGQGAAPADRIVEKQPGAQHPARALAVLMRQDEAHRPDDVRRDGPKLLALLQGLAHQRELVIFEIAQPAMDQLGRGRAGAAGEVARFEQQDFRAAPRRIAGDPGTVHPAADHGDVVGRGGGGVRHSASGCGGPNSVPRSENSTKARLMTAVASRAMASGRAVPS